MRLTYVHLPCRKDAAGRVLHGDGGQIAPRCALPCQPAHQPRFRLPLWLPQRWRRHYSQGSGSTHGKARPWTYGTGSLDGVVACCARFLLTYALPMTSSHSQGRGVWFGPVYPNSTSASVDRPAYPCQDGCLCDIIADPTVHANLRDTLAGVYVEQAAGARQDCGPDRLPEARHRRPRPLAHRRPGRRVLRRATRRHQG